MSHLALTEGLLVPVNPLDKGRRGIQSVEVGSSLLEQLARHIHPLALKDLAKFAGMTAGKAHPYMVSFLKVGFVKQTEAGHYELGPLALNLGLSSLQRMDPVKEASRLIEDLAQETNQSIALAVWGSLGPTIVRLEEPIQPLHVNLRTGTVMSLSNTATGRLFAAYMPSKVVEGLLLDDLSRFGHGNGTPTPITREALNVLLEETRKYGLSRTRGKPIPGIDALCAPVFDADGHIALGILAMGPSATFDGAWDGHVAKALKRCAGEVSRRIGRIEHVPLLQAPVKTKRKD